MRKTFLFLLLFLPIGLYAQSHDCGGIISVGFEQRIVKNFDFGLDAEGRFNHCFTQFDRLKVGASFEFSFLKKKRLKVGAGGYYLLKNDDYLENRWRVQGSLTYTEKIRQFRLSYRVRVQSLFFDERRGSHSFNPKTYLRNRLRIEYMFPQVPVTLYASTEFFLRLYKKNYFIDEFRTLIGCDYRLNKGNKIGIFLRSDNEIQVANPDNTYYVGFSYRFKN